MHPLGTASRDEAAEVPLSLYNLLDPEVLANPYPLYHRLRTHDPVHWDPYLHAWIVTRYEDVITVLTRFSAARTPTPEYFEALGAPEVIPIAGSWSNRCSSWMGRPIRACASSRGRRSCPPGSARCANISRRSPRG